MDGPSPNDVFDFDPVFALLDDVEVHGGFGGSALNPDMPDGSFTRTVLTGRGVRRHVVLANVNVERAVLDGFRIREGSATDPDSVGHRLHGGGILSLGSDVTNAESDENLFENLTIEDCVAACSVAGCVTFAGGGGMYHDGGNAVLGVDIRFCTFRSNHSSSGAALYFNHQGGTLDICNVTLSDNGSVQVNSVSGLPTANSTRHGSQGRGCFRHGQHPSWASSPYLSWGPHGTPHPRLAFSSHLSAWPPNRTREMFNEWFDVETYPVLEDLYEDEAIDYLE